VADPKALVCLVASAIVLDGADTQLLGIVIPSLIKEWAVTRSAFAPVLASGMIGMLVGGAAGGLLGDRFGRKGALLGSVAWFGALTLTASMADGPFTLAVLRFLAGLGLGGALPNAAALASEYVPPQQRAFAVTLAIVSVPVGGMLAAAVAEPVLPMLGWRTLFVIGGVIPVVQAGVLYFILPESPLFKDARQQRVEPASMRSLFVPEFRRDTIGLWLAFFANLVAVYCCFNWIPAMLAGAGFGAAASRGLLAFNLGGVLGAFAGAGLIARFGSRPALLSMATAAIATALVMSRLPIDATAPFVMIGMLAVLGCLLNTLQILMYSVAVHAYPTAIRATGLGFALGSGRVGGVVSTYAGEWALAAGGSAAFFSLIAASMATVGAGLAVVKRHMPRRG
jgi:AAHS family 4-hydroxybenzoate transporter-like MFS transporter